MGRTMEIRLHDEQDGVGKLGPGIRYAVWTQGCMRRCPGCMSPESRNMSGGRMIDVEELAGRIIRSGREGITISGGEPFLQPAALSSLIDLVREKKDIGVIVYTGYTIEELERSEDRDIHDLLKRIDLLVDGEYIEELNDGKNLRGSSNQRAIPLSGRYLKEAERYGEKPAEVEFFMREETICMVGIPSKTLLERFKKRLPEKTDG